MQSECLVAGVGILPVCAQCHDAEAAVPGPEECLDLLTSGCAILKCEHLYVKAPGCQAASCIVGAFLPAAERGQVLVVNRDSHHGSRARQGSSPAPSGPSNPRLQRPADQL